MPVVAAKRPQPPCPASRPWRTIEKPVRTARAHSFRIPSHDVLEALIGGEDVTAATGMARHLVRRGLLTAPRTAMPCLHRTVRACVRRASARAAPPPALAHDRNRRTP